MESIHQKLERVRKPRVHIKYEVETEGAMETKELPFVVGIMGDFSGDTDHPLKPLKDRKFVQIDRDNFDQVLKNMAPGLSFRVDNTLNDDATEIGVNLKFQSITDFEPAQVVEQIPVLKKLLDSRHKLKELLTKIDRSDELENILEKIIHDDQHLKFIADSISCDH